MTWTYDPTEIGTDTAAARINAVRHLVGDTDSTDEQLQNEEIAFHLTQATSDVYLAASLCCESLAAKYSRLVDTSQDDGMLSVKYSQLQTHYSGLRKSLIQRSKRFGSASIGSPVATGISVAANEALDGNTDRVADRFNPDQFRNPGSSDTGDGE